MEKELTYEEFISLAKENYNCGGHSVIADWMVSKSDFDEYVKEFGPITKEEAVNIMTKPLTYEEFISLGKENYDKGGDAIAECWDKTDFDNHVKEFGPITKADVMGMIRSTKSKEDEWNSIREGM